jgi:prepilin-type N-terminal cleavage/methylation domain-containing protein
MLSNRLRLLCRTAHPSSRGGFTLVELLVVIAIIAILAGVALGPITNGLKIAKRNAYMQQGRQVGQVCFAFSTDNTANGNAYPAATAAFTIASNLITAGYATDPNLFGIPGQTGFTKATTSGTTSTLTAASCSWCFTTLGSTTGVTTNASDLIPLVFFNNGFSTSPVGATFTMTSGGLGATITSAAPFQTDGIAIFYKGNNATYVKSSPVNSGTIAAPGFLSTNCTDTTTYTVAP